MNRLVLITLLSLGSLSYGTGAEESILACAQRLLWQLSRADLATRIEVASLLRPVLGTMPETRFSLALPELTARQFFTLATMIGLRKRCVRTEPRILDSVISCDRDFIDGFGPSTLGDEVLRELETRRLIYPERGTGHEVTVVARILARYFYEFHSQTYEFGTEVRKLHDRKHPALTTEELNPQRPLLSPAAFYIVSRLDLVSPIAVTQLQQQCEPGFAAAPETFSTELRRLEATGHIAVDARGVVSRPLGERHWYSTHLYYYQFSGMFP